MSNDWYLVPLYVPLSSRFLRTIGAIAIAVGTLSSSMVLGTELGEMPLVSELSDVRPQDWEYSALRSLVDRYGCLADFPEDNKSAIPRDRFTNLLQSCLSQIKIVQNSDDRHTIDQIERLRAYFPTTVPRIDALETRVTALEQRQFAPEVELEGEAIFAPIFVNRGEKSNRDNFFLGASIALKLKTSFSGKDELEIKLESVQIPELEEVTGTKMSNLGFDGDDGGKIALDELAYTFPLGDRTKVSLYSEGGGLGDYVPTVSPWISDSEEGSISTFAKENPIRRQGSGAGIAISHDFSDEINFSAGYVASRANNPEEGIFSNPNSAIAQLTITPVDFLTFSLTYTNSYNNFRTGTGSELTNNPFNDTSAEIRANGYGAEVAISPSPKVHLGARIGYLQATAIDLSDRFALSQRGNRPQADIFTWAAFLAIEDGKKKENLFGLIFGQPPKVVKNNLSADLQDVNTSLHLEAFYRWQINRNMAVTPGIFAITNPEHNQSNDTIFIGTIRTTFTF